MNEKLSPEVEAKAEEARAKSLVEFTAYLNWQARLYPKVQFTSEDVKKLFEPGEWVKEDLV